MKTKNKPTLTKIGIYNFKAFKDYTEFELDQLTILAGLNSSGKSSIYQSLLLLAQSEDSFITDAYDITYIPHFGRGQFYNIFYSYFCSKNSLIYPYQGVRGVFSE
jgi:hypothetical protein